MKDIEMENQKLDGRSIADTLIYAAKKNKNDLSFTYLELLTAAGVVARVIGVSGDQQAEHLANVQSTAEGIADALIEAANDYKSEN